MIGTVATVKLLGNPLALIDAIHAPPAPMSVEDDAEQHAVAFR